jgi:hypothetical protein
VSESLASLIARREVEQDHYGFTHYVHTEQLRPILAALELLLTEYEQAVAPAPYTTERALYERLRNIVGRA